MADQEVIKTCLACGNSPDYREPCDSCRCTASGPTNWTPIPPLVVKGKMPNEHLPDGHPDKDYDPHQSLAESFRLISKQFEWIGEYFTSISKGGE